MTGQSQYHEYIDAYLQGNLTEQEIELFEIQLLEDRHLQQELQISIALRDALAVIPADSVAGSNSDLLGKKTGEVFGNGLLGLTRRWMPVGIAAFSALFAGVILTLAVTSGGFTGKKSGIHSALPDVPIMTFSRLRSAAQDTSYSYVIDSTSLKSEIAVLELEVDFPTMPEYRVLIAAQSASQGNPTEVVVRPNERGYLVVALPSSYFTPGDYSVTIIPDVSESTNAEEKQLDYSLRVN